VLPIELSLNEFTELRNEALTSGKGFYFTPFVILKKDF
jgi:hypothetical protein